MHIVVANNIYPPHVAGGAELIVSYLAEHLVRGGHQVTVVTTCGPDMEPYADEVVNGVRVIRFFPRNFYWTFDRRPRAPWKKLLWHVRDAWNTAASERMQRIFAGSRPQVLHTHVIDGLSASIWRVAKRSGAGVIHTAHDYHLVCPRAFMMTREWKLCTTPTVPCRAYRRWHLETTRFVDVFASPSRFLANEHVRQGLRARLVDVVPNGIPLPKVRLPNCDNRGAGTFLRMLFAGRLTVEKGVLVALEALRRIPADVDVTLDIAGRGPLAETVERAAERDPRIRYHGYVSGDDKASLFEQADCLLLPSLWYENAPVAIVEAGAYGLGVIASNLGAIPEFVTPGRNGVLFNPGDPADLAKAACRIARDRSILAEFKRVGREFAAASSVEEMSRRYLEHYSHIACPG